VWKFLIPRELFWAVVRVDRKRVRKWMKREGIDRGVAMLAGFKVGMLGVPPYTPAFCMNVKTKELREGAFVTVRRERGCAKLLSARETGRVEREKKFLLEGCDARHFS